MLKPHELEQQRLETLYSYKILDTDPEPAFDEITMLASQLLGMPISLVTLIDVHRQWFKSRVGLSTTETPRDVAFCAHAILQTGVMVVPDALQDQRFRTNPLVVSDPYIRFYAGAPLLTPRGHALGTLCVIDHKPRHLTAQQEFLLRILANQVVAQLELRRNIRELRESIEEKTRIESELYKSNNLFLSVIEGSTDAVFAKNLSGQYILVNSAGAKFIRKTPDEIMGKIDGELFSPDTAEIILARDREVLTSGEPITYEISATAGGITRNYLVSKGPLRNENSDIIGIIGVSRDITESRKAEEALRQSEMRYRGLFEHVLDGVYQSTPDGKLLTANPALVQMLGFESEEEFLATDISSLYVNPLERKKWTSYLAENEFLHNAELVLRRRDGAQVVVLENARAVRDEKGNVMYYEGTLTDITERKKIEQAKDELVSIVAHELRSPLTSIRGSLQYIMDAYSQNLPPQTHKLIELASRGAERLVRLINNMLDIDRIESGKMKWNLQPVALSTVLEQAVEMNEMYGKEYNVQLELQGPVPDITITVDTDAFAQVLTNLLSNAARFSPPNDRVIISAELRGGSVRILVTDNGPGIPEEFRDRIFERFSQAGVQKEGSGLGLSISKAIVERLGGEIGFETEANKGTTFYFDLPVSP